MGPIFHVLKEVKYSPLTEDHIPWMSSQLSQFICC